MPDSLSLGGIGIGGDGGVPILPIALTALAVLLTSGVGTLVLRGPHDDGATPDPAHDEDRPEA
ncbi:hypothetical protein [Streptomyces sp. NPDC059010]|uniref:hypothetical protein n=1 Tax=Streptomyces sp. NPDC059010 TaxID=3346695 RepID=UPI003696D2A9